MNTPDEVLRSYVADMRRHAESSRVRADDHDSIASENALRAAELRASAGATDVAADTIEARLLKEPV